MGYDLVLPVTRGCLTEVLFFIGDLGRPRPPHRSSFVGLRIRMHAAQDLQENVLNIVMPCTRAEPSLVAPSHSYPLYPEKKTSFAVESSVRMTPNRSRSSLRKCTPKTSGACCESVQRPARTDKKKLLFPFDRRPPFGRHAGISASASFSIGW